MHRLVVIAAMEGNEEQVRILLREHLSVDEVTNLWAAVRLLHKEFVALGRELSHRAGENGRLFHLYLAEGVEAENENENEKTGEEHQSEQRPE